jgi:hypothetical protein
MTNRNEHLKLAVDYIQNRVNAIDNKTSVLKAIQAGLFGVATFVADQLATVSKLRLFKRASVLSEEDMLRTGEAIKIQLDIY